MFILFLYFLNLLKLSNGLLDHHRKDVTRYDREWTSSKSLIGVETECKYTTKYETHPGKSFEFCKGNTVESQKHGMSIMALLDSRGYLPTCRVMQLMLWMAAEAKEKKHIHRNYFVDIGANIGFLFRC